MEIGPSHVWGGAPLYLSRLRRRGNVVGVLDDFEQTCNACGAKVLEIDVRCEACGAALASTGAMRMIGGVVLEHYLIEEVLGQGGMSVVYKGRHELTGQEVALKILPPELAAHAQVKSRFLEEAKALAALDHPNIVHLYNFGEDNGCFVLAMQFVKGQTLERLIWSSGRLDWRLACRIGIDTLKALEYAHAQGIVHRDMKPSNILVRASDGAATVMDFGIAKMTTSSRLTATGQTMGTVRYMSPEQVRGQPVDRRTDIYSFAISLYESLVGDTPFDGETHFEIMTKHLGEAPKPPSSHGVELPAALEAILMAGMAKNPDDRPHTAAEFQVVLEKVLEGQVVPEIASITRAVKPSQLKTTAAAKAGAGLSPPVGLATRLEGDELILKTRPKPWLWLAIGAVVAAGGAGVAAMVVRSSTPEAAVDASTTAAVVAIDAGARWPNPFLLPDLRISADRRFDDLELRIITSGGDVDSERVRDEILAARTEFRDFLRGRGVDKEISWEPLNVVLVAPHVLCDPRLYDGDAPDECADLNSYYRPREKTLYLVEDDTRRVRSLPYDVGLSLCLHRQSAIPDCERALTAFLRANEAVE